LSKVITKVKKRIKKIQRDLCLQCGKPVPKGEYFCSLQCELATYEQFLNISRGKVDVKNRLMLLLNPDIPKTSTKLTHEQVQFITLCHFVAKSFPEDGFEALEDFATELELASISHEGWGVDSSIRLSSAISESKLMQRLAIFKSEETKAVKGKA